MSELTKLISSVNLLNCKVLAMYKQKSINSISGRSEWYRNNVAMDRILDFIHHNQKKSKDEQDIIKNTKDYTLFDFWKYINRDLPDLSK